MNIRLRKGLEQIINIIFFILGIGVLLIIIFNKKQDSLYIGLALSLTSLFVLLRGLIIDRTLIKIIFDIIIGLLGTTLGICSMVLKIDVFPLAMFCRLWGIFEISEGFFDILFIFMAPKKHKILFLIEVLLGILQIFFGVGLLILLEKSLTTHLIYLCAYLLVQAPLYLLETKLNRV